MKYFIFFISLLSFFSCKNEKKKNHHTRIETDIQGAKSIPVETIEEVELKVHIDNLRLRKGPNVNFDEIIRLPENTILLFSGIESTHYSKIKLRGVQMNAPWLQVKMKNGQLGWVYAGGVKPNTNSPSKANQIVDNIYLHSFFGKKLMSQIRDYNLQHQTAKTSEEFATVYILGENIQEEINNILSEKIEVTDTENMLDMSWLERSMKDFQTSLVAEGTQFHLFKNYKKMNAKAVQTSGDEDDFFFQLQFKANSIDSIEHFFKSWFIQTWDYGGHSLLGQSTHYEIIAEADDQIAKSNLFKKPIRQLVQEVMDDILNSENSFWESKEDILQEMTAIISRDFDILTKEEKIALATRFKMFENAEANKIDMNLRAGNK